MSISLATHQAHITWDAGADPLSESDYKAIIQDIYPKDVNNQNGDFLWALKSRHMDYSHTEAGLGTYHNGQLAFVGDCTTPVTPKLGPLGVVVNVASDLASKIGDALVPGASAIPQNKQGLLGILSGIFTHHAQAIATEQNDLCAAAIAANNYLDGVDYNFYNGVINQSQAETSLSALRTGYRAMVAPVYKLCNAACIQADILDALIYMRTNFLYPKYVFPTALAGVIPAPIARVTSEVGNGVSTIVSKLSGGVVTLSSGMGFVVLGILLLAGIATLRISRRTA